MKKNFSELNKFFEYWRDMPDFRVAAKGLCIFKAEIRYKFHGTQVKHITEVMIQRSGFKDGTVSLTESGPFISETFHLDFSPEWQTYRYSEKTHSLSIKGNSEKMHGDYKVIIRPIS